MSSYFDDKAPWKNIKTETIDGQVMVKIPKFYVKYGTVSGRPTWWVSDVAATGFEVHPAFLRKGQEMSCFYIGAYASTAGANNGTTKATSVAGNSVVSVQWQNLVKCCAARGTGWHCVNIYEHMAIALLMLIEMGGPDMQTLLGTGTEVNYGATSNNGSKSNWRGIYSLWGHNWEACTGLYVNAGTLQVWDANGNENKVTTSATIPTNFSATFWEGFATANSGSGNTKYDLRYLFLPTAAAASEAASATADAAWSNTSADRICWIGGYSDDGSHCGMFCFALNRDASFSGVGSGVRLAKYGDNLA